MAPDKDHLTGFACDVKMKITCLVPSSGINMDMIKIGEKIGNFIVNTAIGLVVGEELGPIGSRILTFGLGQIENEVEAHWSTNM